jgi:iron complex outermembrane receptor protein/outer membrane receptor for ferric coprogen and ferric-rhodotorulic acid
LQGWSIGGGVAYRSEFYAQSGALRLVSGDYALLNAQVAYQINDHLGVSLTVDNLLDKTYYEKVSGMGRQNFYGEPRRVTVALKARY